MQKKLRLPRNPSRPRNNEEFNLLKKIGDRIYKDLSKENRPVEWLAFEAETARSTIRRIFDGDGNIGLVTLHRVVQALGYKDVTHFFKSL